MSTITTLWFLSFFVHVLKVVYLWWHLFLVRMRDNYSFRPPATHLAAVAYTGDVTHSVSLNSENMKIASDGMPQWFVKEHCLLKGSGLDQFVLRLKLTCWRMDECGAMVQWYWRGKAEVLGEKHYRVWVVDEWMGMEQWWNDTDRGKLKYWEKNIIECGY